MGRPLELRGCLGVVRALPGGSHMKMGLGENGNRGIEFESEAENRCGGDGTTMQVAVAFQEGDGETLQARAVLVVGLAMWMATINSHFLETFGLSTKPEQSLRTGLEKCQCLWLPMKLDWPPG